MKNKENHVFIVGIPRSGTSIIYRTIQQLLNFRSTKLNLWETGIFQDHISFDSSEIYYPSLLGYLNNQRDEYDLFLESINGYTEKLKSKKKWWSGKFMIKRKYHKNFINKLKFSVLLKINEILWKCSYKRKIIQKYFTHVKKSRNSKRIVEKTPRHYLHIHKILWTFPNARIIWMIRHPVEIKTSATRRAKIDKNFMDWNNNAFINEFRYCYYLFDVYKKMFYENIILVKYEDFVDNSTNSLREICGFLDEPFSGDALIINKDEKINFKPDPHLFSEIVKDTKKNWTDYLSIDEAKKIENALQSLMKKYNFDFYTKS